MTRAAVGVTRVPTRAATRAAATGASANGRRRASRGRTPPSPAARRLRARGSWRMTRAAVDVTRVPTQAATRAAATVAPANGRHRASPGTHTAVSGRPPLAARAAHGERPVLPLVSRGYPHKRPRGPRLPAPQPTGGTAQARGRTPPSPAARRLRARGSWRMTRVAVDVTRVPTQAATRAAATGAPTSCLSPHAFRLNLPPTADRPRPVLLRRRQFGQLRCDAPRPATDILPVAPVAIWHA